MIFNVTSGGGGAALNFKVVRYASVDSMESSSPSENTVGVVTDLDISEWVCSASTPSNPTNGMVWITINPASRLSFNALKKNCIMVYPMSVSQYKSGSWVVVEAGVYQKGTWEKFVKYLYNYDKLEYSWSTTGKKYSSTVTNFTENAPTITTESDGSLKISQSKQLGGGIAYISTPINLTDYKTLKFDGVLNDTTGGYAYGANLFIWSSIGTYITSNQVKISKAPLDGSTEIDISDITGSHYIGFGILNTGSYATVRSLSLTT